MSTIEAVTVLVLGYVFGYLIAPYLAKLWMSIK